MTSPTTALVPSPAPLAERLLRAYARHFPLHRGKVRLVDTLWRAAAGRAGATRTATLTTGHRIHCDLNQQLQRQYYYFGTYWRERREIACWQNVARQSRTILDVGANLGIYTWSARAANPACTVHAFEPTPAHAAHLRHTIKVNSVTSVHVHEAAVGRESGEAVLNLWSGESRDNEGMNFVTDAPQTAESLPVRVVSLDDFCDTNGIDSVDLLKMDVQGNEQAVLSGARRMLGKGRIGTVFVELNWEVEAGGTSPASEVVDSLSRLGFEFSEPVWPLRFRDAGPWLRSCTDIVARKARSGRAA